MLRGTHEVQKGFFEGGDEGKRKDLSCLPVEEETVQGGGKTWFREVWPIALPKDGHRGVFCLKCSLLGDAASPPEDFGLEFFTHL